MSRHSRGTIRPCLPTFVAPTGSEVACIKTKSDWHIQITGDSLVTQANLQGDHQQTRYRDQSSRHFVLGITDSVVGIMAAWLFDVCHGSLDTAVEANRLSPCWYKSPFVVRLVKPASALSALLALILVRI